jgi:predicted transcriptional regulator
MSDGMPLHGELQQQVMNALWRLDSATVEEVREALPPRYRSAYNTVQTVLNRLTERGLLSRTRVGRSFRYRPALTEADYVARSIRQALAAASNDVRRAALAELIGELQAGELTEVQRRAEDIQRQRTDDA